MQVASCALVALVQNADKAIKYREQALQSNFFTEASLADISQLFSNYQKSDASAIGAKATGYSQVSVIAAPGSSSNADRTQATNKSKIEVEARGGNSTAAGAIAEDNSSVTVISGVASGKK